MRPEEHATVDRRSTDFPERWGPAPEKPETRASWVKANVMREMPTTAPRAEHRRRAEADMANVRRQMILAERRYGPGELADLR